MSATTEIAGLPLPARYFPLRDGRYTVSPGLRPLGRDFGNGAVDAHVFQMDREFPLYRKNKDRCREEQRAKYCLTHDFAPEVEQAIVFWMSEQLAAEHPQHFTLSDGADGRSLTCMLTGERLRWDRCGAYVGPSRFTSAFDAIAHQVQEDLAVVRCRRDEAGSRDWLAAIHLCAPNHWAAADKIGRSFIGLHEPIPGIDEVNRSAEQLVEAMIYRTPYVRFAWGVATDRQLNHHPEPPPGGASGRRFDPSRPKLFIRVERQTLRGFPAAQAALFTIRTYFLGVEELSREERRLLKAALHSMSPESRVYKGVAHDFAAIEAYLLDLGV